jgi:hypothetical protein
MGFALPTRIGDRHDLTNLPLDDARESLAYWEDRSRRLPRHALRRRREAREMTLRWQARVAEAERAHYGRGLLGALLLLAAERRLPEPTRRAGRQIVRRTAQAALVLVVALVAMVVAGLYAAVEVVAALLDALA